MSTNIATLPGWVNAKDITTALAAGSLTITKAQAYTLGSIKVIQLTYSDTTISYIKWKNGRLKVGGTDNTFGTGTEFTWQA